MKPTFIHLYSSLSSGFSTEDTVFVKTGASVQLNIQRDKLPDEFEEIFWQNEKSDTIVKYYNKFKDVKYFDDYKDRVDFNTESFSLTLKNMKKTDSGVYTAKITGKSNRDVAEHRVSVIDAVKTPELTVISYWSSSDSCTVNFTCRAHDLTLNSTYNNDNCSPEEVTSHEKFTIILICSNEAIICNHSNPVSSETERIDIKQLCKGNERHNRFPPSQTYSVFSVLMVVVVAGVIVFCGLVLYCCCRNKKGFQKDANIDYDDVETLTHIHKMTEDIWTTVTYNTVDQRHKP
ncbi:CD48 antigen-like isoform X2 [Paramisgurnus dabryanus]|uniref:CD48 antigen-like isoform X2 n=1 Tax=Paramisgurnus dabryanus TaxID=90735 RepID=UPI0031F33B53